MKVVIKFGRLHPVDPNSGLIVKCYVCGESHKALHLVHIEAPNQPASDFPLCARCFDGAEIEDAVLQKFLKWSDLKIRDMTDDEKKVVDFEAAKDARIEAEIDKDEAHWGAVRDQLLHVMTSGLSDIGITSATLNALIERLTTLDGLSLEDAKAQIAKTLRPFGEWGKPK